MDRRTVLATTGTMFAAAGGGCLVDGVLGGLREADYDIGMSRTAFLPDIYETTVGEQIVWGNNGSRGHTVTAYEHELPDTAAYFASGGFETEAAARDAWHASQGGNIQPGDTYTHTFHTRGPHPYFCIPHEAGGMTGVIHVTD